MHSHPLRPFALVLTALFLLLASPRARAGEVKEKEPGPRSTGKVYQWKSEDGLVYVYRVPKRYDADEGANLTFLLHGSNLTHGWGFDNHSEKTFRPDDIVVSPDGTTSNGKGGFNFLGEKKDAKRFKAFVEELKGIFNVRQVFLYGHSQGSFFSLFFAGEYPDLVDGVVAHASGVWTWTQQGPKGHDLAIVLMHGTQDPVVPYGQSVGGYGSYAEKKYPIVRLRSLEHWNHWPAEHNGKVPHTSQQVTWCEGMTTEDPERLRTCFAYLADVENKERHDWAALRQVANRIADLESAPDELRRKAAKAVEVVDALAIAHVEALEIPEKGEFEGGAWAVHLPVFLRQFQGVPACEELRETWDKLLTKHDKHAIKYLEKYWPSMRKGDADKAFSAGVAALEKGFLFHGCQDRQFRNNLAAWRKDAKKHKLSKKDLKTYDAFIKDYEKAWKDGFRAFDKVNAKAGKP